MEQSVERPIEAPGAQPDALAESPLTAIAPKQEAVRRLGSVPSNVLGYPLFAWVGAAVFLFIAYNLFGGYL
jgi:hypothetical protein